MKRIDLYSGFEGEREVFWWEKTVTDEVICEVEMWNGYFDSIMELIPFNPTSHPDSFIYKYHTTPFEDTIKECPRLQEFYDQLVEVEAAIPSVALNAYNVIKDICNSAILNGNRVFYLYD
ncbi:hypothetical protein [Desertivirga brevis]|uniref:hypothetical protein n=1 Tax=Desertivirga brevis TaxID=2810310 RepID=UPI001A97C9C2|nr:hypothetical protein [Pedobacter sp. SYSU D00873]